MKITYQKPEIVDLTGMDALGQCNAGSGDSTCSVGQTAGLCGSVGNNPGVCFIAGQGFTTPPASCFPLGLAFS